MRKIDLTGQRFGRWTVVGEAHKKGEKVSWLCRCDCGNSAVVMGGSLAQGTSRSCGCLKREKTSANLSKDMTGLLFGLLTVMSRAGSSKTGQAEWRCKCQCGNIVFVRGAHLRNGNTKSCGCLRKHREKKWASKKEMYSSPVSKKSSLFKQIPLSDGPMADDSGVITVVCKTCGKRFYPTRSQIHSRLKCIRGTWYGESNFYCSDECKLSCPVYHAHSNHPDPRLRKPKSVTAKARACQSKTLKQIQCDDNNGQSYCERCGDLIDVELHHTLPVAEYGEGAINPAGHILLCAGCHMALHRECA